MAKRKGFKRNEVKVDLCAYPPYIIQGVPKSGKTTLFYELVEKVYGSQDKGLLISFGEEEGYLALDDIQYEETKDWDEEWDDDTELRGFIQIVDDLIENKKEYGMKMIGLDTFDWMVEVLIKEVKRQHKKLKGEKCKSLNDAMGGYGKGRDLVNNLMIEQIARLRKAGYAVFILAHTKVKEKTDALTGLTYDQLTNNIRADIYSTIENIAQMVVTINIEKQIEDGKLIGEKRMMNFRSNGTIDCGGRFKGLPEKLELSAENFMNAFEIGVNNAFRKKKSEEEIQKIKEKQEIERNEKAEALNKTVLITEMVDKIKAGFNELGDGAKLKMQEFVEDAKIESLDDLREEHRIIVEKMYDLIK